MTTRYSHNDLMGHLDLRSVVSLVGQYENLIFQLLANDHLAQSLHVHSPRCTILHLLRRCLASFTENGVPKEDRTYAWRRRER